MLTTPESIRTLQRKLYRKAKQEPAYRFYALYDKVYRADILSHAYRLVRANKGSAGIDGVTFEAIENAEGETAFMAELQEALKSKSYAPSPVKRVMIPKADGSKRPLGIPTIRDRVAQMAVKLVIEPIFEADFVRRLIRIQAEEVRLTMPSMISAMPSTAGIRMSLMPMYPSTSTASRTPNCWPSWPSASWTARYCISCGCGSRRR